MTPALLVAAGVAAGVALVARMRGLAADESYYAPQVRLFMEGRWELAPGITMLPGFHLGIAALGRLFGPYSDFLARMANLAGGLALLPLVARIARRHAPEAAALRAAQVFFLPLLYPYFFLIYTEPWSLVALAAMVAATLEGRIALAAVAGFAGVLLRQDFIAWVGFAWILAVAPGLDPRDLRASMAAIARRAWREALPLGLVMVAFVGFVAWHRGIAMADTGAQALRPNPANIDLFLLCTWLLFLPLAIAALPRIAAALRGPWPPAILAAGFLAYFLGYSNPHVYNQAHLRFFLHNQVLYGMDTRPWLKAALYVPIAWGALLLLATRLPERRCEALYAVAPIAFLLHPLVEQRYYLPAFVLYNAWRPFAGRRMEWMLLALYVPVAIFLLRGIARGAFFL